MADVMALPKQSTLQLTSGERALGRLTTLSLPSDPEGDPQADLAGDAFFAMYKNAPAFRDEVAPERSVNKTLIDWAQQTQGWEASRANTISNLPAALAASELLWQSLTADDTLKAALEKQRQADEAAQKARADEAAAEGLRAAGRDADADKVQALANKRQAEAEQLAQEAAEALDDTKTGGMGHAAVAGAVKKAGEKAKETAGLMAGWGMGPGSDVRMDPTAALEFIRTNNAKLKRIAELAGRMRGVALQARRERVVHGAIPAAAGLTQDLTRVFPSELAFIRPDAPAMLRAQKIAQFAEGGLLGWRLRGDADKRGPFVAAVDVSGSMRKGGREIVAKAVALGVAQAAKAEGRPYILFTFGSHMDPVCVCASSQDWKAHLEWASYSRGGGTCFDSAITEIMERLLTLGKHARGR